MIDLALVAAVFLLLVNLMTYRAFTRDKTAARRGGWRVPETTLLLLALVGGWPAARLAQVRLRHKTRKEPFRTVLAWIGRAQLGALAIAAALAIWQPGSLGDFGSGLAAFLETPEQEQAAMPRRFGPRSPGW